MFYSANGKFIIKENFETDRLETKAKDNNSLDIWHYDVNGNLRTGTKVSNNGNYEIWTGYCYDNNCPSLYGKNKPNLVVDKDGTTFVKKICIDNECLTKNDIKLNKFFHKLIIKGIAGESNIKTDVNNLSDGEMSLFLNSIQNYAETEEANSIDDEEDSD